MYIYNIIYIIYNIYIYGFRICFWFYQLYIDCSCWVSPNFEQNHFTLMMKALMNSMWTCWVPIGSDSLSCLIQN